MTTLDDPTVANEQSSTEQNALGDLDRIDPVPEEVKLSSGLVVSIQPLRTRQFFKLLRIVTRGSAPILGSIDFTDDDFVQKFFVLVLFSVPEAEQETIEFIQSMTQPKGTFEGRKLTKDQEAKNNELWSEYDETLSNPELDDTVSIVEKIIALNKDDLVALGKRLKTMFSLAEKTGQIPAQKG